MFVKELTITTGKNNEYTYPYYAELTANKDGKWLGVTFGNSAEEVVSKMLQNIAKHTDTFYYHTWRD